MPYKDVYLIGLTGNIACGKSTVLAVLRELGAQVIDADRVTHELQQPGEPVYDAIVAEFGPGILTAPGGAIDRRVLGATVFADAAALRRLEQLVHPAVRERLRAWLEEIAVGVRGSGASELSSSRPQVAVVDAIKLLEAGWRSSCNAIWVVTCTVEQQIERLMTTRGMSEAEARARIAAQPPQSEKIAQADVVIDNSGSLDATRQQIEQAWRQI
jgi:dephospho-CoA kinase